ncbi:MAG TPA: hypothetical protein VGF61_15005 [Candidatus Acidoferrum sp.]|jgi:hypothetical protein
MFSRNSGGSEPRLPYFWQADFRYFLLGFAGGNLLSHQRDCSIQELDILREVAAIGNFSVPVMTTVSSLILSSTAERERAIPAISAPPATFPLLQNRSPTSTTFARAK